MALPGDEGGPPGALKLKAFTAVATAALALGLLLVEWEPVTGGQPNVFSGVRPAVKSALNRFYGREGAAASPPPPPPPAQAERGGS